MDSIKVKRMLVICRAAFGSDADVVAFLETRNAGGEEEILVCDDFCAASATANGCLAKALSGSEAIVVAACQPRAVKALLKYAGIDPAVSDAACVEDRRGNRGCVRRKGRLELPENPSHVKVVDTPDNVPFWFPVIDRERCEACGACAEFCLFGVYAKVENGVPKVVLPGNCKDQCPACARICPVGAVVFPKFHSPPINGGEVSENPTPVPPLSSLSPDDLHAALTKRSASSRRKGLYKNNPPR